MLFAMKKKALAYYSNKYYRNNQQLIQTMFDNTIQQYIRNTPNNYCDPIMSNNQTMRRRISYAPIIVTSKSISSLDHSQAGPIFNDKKNNNPIKKPYDFITNKTNSRQTLANQQPTNRLQPTQQTHIPPQSKQQHSQQILNKIKNPSIVRLDFENQTLKHKRKLQIKVLNLGSIERQLTIKQNRGLHHFTNIKTFQQFAKMSKIETFKKSSNNMRDQIEEEWKKYLDKYHLNINTIKPLLRNMDHTSLPPYKNKSVEQTQQKHNKKNTLFAGFQSNRHFKSFSKRQSYKKCQIDLATPSQRSISLVKQDKIDSQTVYKKIEHDITSNKLKGNKKDHFVFALSQNNITSPEAILKNKLDIYKDFLFRINFTNGLYVKPREETDRQLKAFVGIGNNSLLIQGILRRRFWWQIVDKVSDDVNFVWTQLKISHFLKSQPRSNTKLGKKHKIQLFQSEPVIDEGSDANKCVKQIMYGRDMRLWKKYNQKYSKYQSKGLDYGLPKRVNGLLKKKTVTFIQNSNKLKVHNHLQCNYFLGNKKALFYSMKKYYELLNINPFTKIPLTFHITQGLQDPDFLSFLQEFQNQKRNKHKDKDFRNVWIIKPGELTNRGQGITVCSTLDQIKTRIKSKQRNSNGTARSYILQKYLQKPLLYQGRKFDIRHYMMINCHNGQIKGYWYQQGYIRTTSSEYNIKNTKDIMTHLTNDAVQKNGQNYGKFEVGNKVSYSDFQKYISNQIDPNIDFYQRILPNMKQLATQTIRATYLMLDPERKQHNFQLFGLDFMLDQAFNVYLIEVNTNPCLETSCPLLAKIITPLMENVFKIGLDPLFPPPYEWPAQKKYNLGTNAVQQNKFELVFDEFEEGPKLKQLYRNSAAFDSKMGDIFEEEQQYQEDQKQWVEQEELQNKKQK